MYVDTNLWISSYTTSHSIVQPLAQPFITNRRGSNTIKTHSSESRDQERAKWIAKNKTCNKLLLAIGITQDWICEYFKSYMRT